MSGVLQMNGAFLVLSMTLGLGVVQSAAQANGAKPEDGKKVHLSGARARILISLLVSGNSEILNRVKNLGSSEIALRDLAVESESTYKYDSGDPFYRLDVRLAKAKLAPEYNVVYINEASALHDFLTPFGLDDDLALEGSYREIPELDCKINASLPVDNLARFQCDLVLPSWAHPKAAK